MSEKTRTGAAVYTAEDYKVLLSNLLKCGTEDIDIIMAIDDELVNEALGCLVDEGIDINFPSLYHECAEIALNELHAKAEIDNNYSCAHIWLMNPRKQGALEELGFNVTV